MADFPGNVWFGEPTLLTAREATAPYPGQAVAEPCGTGGSGGVTNRVWYTPGAFEVRWQTATPDVGGVAYPGPGTFGADTVQFAVDDPGNP